MTYRQGGETGHGYIPRTQEKTGQMTMIPVNPTGPLTAKSCGKLAEFLAQAPWDEQRDGLITTHPELEKHLKSHNLICRRLTEMLEGLQLEAIPTEDSKILQHTAQNLQSSILPAWPQEWL